MPSLRHELDELTRATQHVAEADARLRKLKHELEEERRSGAHSVALLEELVDAMEGSLDAFRDHEALIRQAIEDIRAGRLPNSDGAA